MTRSSWLAAPALCGLALLSGCGSLLGGRESAPVTYVLRPTVAAVAVPGAGTKSLQVQRVVVAPGYARDEILRTEPDRRLGQYASSRWPDALPSVVERLAVDAARGSGAWSVGVVIDATVSRRLDRTLLSAFTVETSAQAADDRMSAIVAAFDEAAGEAMDRIARRAAATE